MMMILIWGVKSYVVRKYSRAIFCNLSQSDSYLSDAKNSKVDYIGMIEDKEEEDKVKVNDKKEPLSKPVTHAPEETKDIVHSNGDDYKGDYQLPRPFLTSFCELSYWDIMTNKAIKC